MQEIGQVTELILQDAERLMAERAGRIPARISRQKAQRGGNGAAKSGERAECIVLRFPLERIHRWPWQCM